MAVKVALLSAGRKWMAVAASLGVVRIGATAGLVWWAATRLEGGLTPGSAAAAVILLMTRSLAVGLTPPVAAEAASRVEQDLRLRLFRKVVELGALVDRDRRTGELVSQATAGVEAVGAYAGTFVPLLVSGLLGPLVVLGFISWVDPPTGLVLLLGLLLVPALLRLLEKRFRSVSDRYRDRADRLAARFLDAVQALPTLKAYGRARRFGERLTADSEGLRRQTMRLLAVNQVALLAVDSMFTLATVVAATGLVIWRSSMAAVSGAAVVLLAAVLVEAVAQIGRFFYVGAIGRASARAVRRLLEIPSPMGVLREVEPTRGGVELSDVTFAYPGGPPVLEGVSLVVEPGETVALVGPSGSGKTTIAYLVLGLLSPSGGRVVVAGHDLAETGRAWAGRAVTFVPQAPYLFGGTIADNLRMARPDASPELLETVARAAHLDELIERLPDGWNTQVGERGLALSGGEAQRLAIARALLRDTPIVILDEPTANLDLHSEAAVTDGISRLTEGKTVIVIAHRATTVARADRVVVLEAGRVVEVGTPGELTARGGLFSRMVGT